MFSFALPQSRSPLPGLTGSEQVSSAPWSTSFPQPLGHSLATCSRLDKLLCMRTLAVYMYLMNGFLIWGSVHLINNFPLNVDCMQICQDASWSSSRARPNCPTKFHTREFSRTQPYTSIYFPCSLIKIWCVKSYIACGFYIRGVKAIPLSIYMVGKVLWGLLTWNTSSENRKFYCCPS